MTSERRRLFMAGVCLCGQAGLLFGLRRFSEPLVRLPHAVQQPDGKDKPEPGETLRCLTARNPTAWSSSLPWAEYVQNSLVFAATGVSPFMASLGYQPPLFEHQEEEIAVPALWGNLRRCRNIWRQVLASLLCSSLQTQKQANGTSLSPRTTSLAVHEGPKVCRSVRGRSDGKRGRRLSEASSTHEGPPSVPCLPCQASGGIRTVPSGQGPYPGSDHCRRTRLHSPADP